MGAGGGGCEQRRAKGGDAQFGCGAGQGVQSLRGQMQAGQAGAGFGQLRGIKRDGAGVRPWDIGQVQKQRQAVGQGRGQAFIGLCALIQRDQAMGGGIKRGGQTGGKAGRRAFGHGQHKGGWLRQQAGGQDGLAGCQRGGQVQATKQRIIRHTGMQPPQGQGQRRQRRCHQIARRAGAGTQPQPAQSGRINGQQCDRSFHPAPRFGQVCQGSTSDTARMTRLVDRPRPMDRGAGGATGPWGPRP